MCSFVLVVLPTDDRELDELLEELVLEEYVVSEVLELYEELELEECLVRVEPELYVVFLCVVCLSLSDVVFLEVLLYVDVCVAVLLFLFILCLFDEELFLL